MSNATKMLKCELSNIARSRWLIGLAALLFVITEVMFRFGGDAAKTVTSLMNIVLIVVPLISVVLGTIYFYNSREFNELVLAQPVARSSVYLGKLAGFTGALCAAFLVGTGAPFLVHSYQLAAYAGKIITLLAVGCSLIIIFSSLAFYAATRYEDRIKGLGLALMAWFFLAVIWDGLILLFVHVFQDYPYEPGLVGLVFLNPIDLGRILVLLQLDIAALMGYTGAVFRKVFGSDTAITYSALAMLVYTAVPVLLGLRTFSRKDF